MNVRGAILIAAAITGLVTLASPARADRCDDSAKELSNQVDRLKVNFRAANVVYLTHPAAFAQRTDAVMIFSQTTLVKGAVAHDYGSAGWLEIKPPVGSFSWINGKYVKQIDARFGVVDADPGRPVPVLPGSTLVNQEPNRESIKLTMGTIVIIVDRPLSVNGETWLPIQPHPSEVRFIPVESVRQATQVAVTNNAPNWTLTTWSCTGPKPHVMARSVCPTTLAPLDHSPSKASCSCSLNHLPITSKICGISFVQSTAGKLIVNPLPAGAARSSNVRPDRGARQRARR